MSEVITVAGSNKRKLTVVFIVTALYMVAEIIGGFSTKSLALLADAGHMLTDVGSLGLTLLAIRFAERPANARKTYGYHRAEMLAAFLNAIALLFISAYILYEAWRRFENPPVVMSGPMLAVASLGLVVNLIGMWMLNGSHQSSLNMRGAYLEVLSDTLGSVGVIVASIIMLTTKWYLADPIISAGIGIFIVPRTWTLLKQAAHILMEGTPLHINLDELQKGIMSVPGVKEVHDLHVWTITSGFDAMSGHVTVTAGMHGYEILDNINKILRDSFGIEHTTIQIEKEKNI